MTRASDTARLVSGGAVINEASNDVDFRVESNGNTHALFVDAGNDKVGIKEDSPSCDFVVKQSGSTFTTASQTVGLFQRNSATGSGCKVTILSGNASSGDLNFGDAEDEDIGKLAYEHNNNAMTFTTNASERMRIDSSGNVVIGDTSSSALFRVKGQTAPLAILFNSDNSDKVVLQMRHDFARSGQNSTMIQFLNNDGDEKGSIKTSATATQFNTSSDYRLKENVSYDWDATSRLKQLKPCRFNWISDETNTLVDGFLAHEVSNSVPEAITGDKDATETYTDDDGKEKTRIKPQGIDQSKLVPLLVKTIQELEARIAKLESK